MSMLFAEVDFGSVMVFLVVIIGLACVLGVKAYIFFNRPDIWEAQQRLKLEKERQQQELRARSRNQLATGVAGALLKAFLGHHH
jgi:hypothetical protein